MSTTAEHSIAIAIALADDEIDGIIAECGGAREAIRALLHDLAVLATDAEASVSHGYVRGRLLRIRLKEEECDPSYNTL
jgi:hypothetical protein